MLIHKGFCHSYKNSTLVKVVALTKVPNWLLREYAVILALPISLLLNASYKQQRLPSIWKFANASLLPKVKMVQDLKNELRPISLTPNISKVAEHFVVKDYVKPAVLKKIDPNQYGAIPKSSTIFALFSMVHNWTSGLDGTGSTTRIILFDYQKAFDLINHRILINQLPQLDLPRSVINWIIDFLSDRFQRKKQLTKTNRVEHRQLLMKCHNGPKTIK